MDCKGNNASVGLYWFKWCLEDEVWKLMRRINGLEEMQREEGWRGIAALCYFSVVCPGVSLFKPLHPAAFPDSSGIESFRCSCAVSWEPVTEELLALLSPLCAAQMTWWERAVGFNKLVWAWWLQGAEPKSHPPDWGADVPGAGQPGSPETAAQQHQQIDWWGFLGSGQNASSVSWRNRLFPLTASASAAVISFSVFSERSGRLCHFLCFSLCPACPEMLQQLLFSWPTVYKTHCFNSE